MPRIAPRFRASRTPGARDPLAARHDWYVLIEVASQVADGLDEAMTALLADALELG